jgi:putative aminopeptidase FrvX
MDKDLIAFGAIAGFLASKIFDMIFGNQKEMVVLMRDVRDRLIGLEVRQLHVEAEVAEIKDVHQDIRMIEKRVGRIESNLAI